MQMLLTPEQESSLKSLSHMLFDGDVEYYHNPLWFKSLGDGIYECLRWDELPEHIKDLYLSSTGIKTPA